MSESGYKGYGKSKSHTSVSTSKAPQDQFVTAVRKSALPRMQGVVHSLRRTMTGKKKQRAGLPKDGDRGFSNNRRKDYGLLPDEDTAERDRERLTQPEAPSKSSLS